MSGFLVWAVFGHCGGSRPHARMGAFGGRPDRAVSSTPAMAGAEDGGLVEK